MLSNLMLDSWVLAAIFVCFTTSFQVILMKKISLFDNIVKSSDSILVVFILTGLISFLYLLRKPAHFKNTIIKISKNNIVYITLMSILLLVGRQYFIKSVGDSPNPGYSHLIINFNAILTIFLSFVVFGIRVNRYTLIGSIIAITGMIIVVKYSKH